jgi:hypothetical protein
MHTDRPPSDTPRLRLCTPDQLLAAHPGGEPDYILLLRPDTHLSPLAADHLLSCAARIARYDPTPAVIVGATRCPATGVLATSALLRRAPGSRSYTRVEPMMACLPADTFDPNCLLFPRSILASLRNVAHVPPMTPALGTRLRRLGFNIFLAPGYAGTAPLPNPARRAGVATRQPI